MFSSVSLCLLLIGLNGVNAEEYSTLASLAELYDTKAVLLKVLEEYINSTEHRLQQLKRRAAAYSKEHEEARVNVSSYLSNPVNGYLLIKRLTTDWNQTESLMFAFIDEVKQNMVLYRQMQKFPIEKDLAGAAQSLMRLQDSSSVNKTELNNVHNSSHLSADDCFELGIKSYNNEDFYHTFVWMVEALLRNDTSTLTRKRETLEYLGYSTYKLGNVRKALHITEEWLTIDPNNPRALQNQLFYQGLIEKSGNSEDVDQGLISSPSANNYNSELQDPYAANINTDGDIESYYDTETYEMLCRNDLSPSPALLAQLKCRYAHNNVSFLRIAPLKQEEAYLKPRILLYRDVMSDREIELIMKIAEPRLNQAVVQNYIGETNTVETVVSNHRRARVAWIKNEDDDVAAKINQRVEDMTSLLTLTAEQLQVVSYGIDDYYKPHFDFLDPSQCLDDGNRIATVLFYMNDVPKGGATVFPTLHLSVWPKKGTAVFWHNLLHNGEFDQATIHAACPVVDGSKWVSTKWIRERGQEFRRPCSLENE